MFELSSVTYNNITKKNTKNILLYVSMEYIHHGLYGPGLYKIEQGDSKAP